MNDNSLITYSFLKKFADKCKNIFLGSKKATKKFGNYILIKTSIPFNNGDINGLTVEVSGISYNENIPYSLQIHATKNDILDTTSYSVLNINNNISPYCIYIGENENNTIIVIEFKDAVLYTDVKVSYVNDDDKTINYNSLTYVDILQEFNVEDSVIITANKNHKVIIIGEQHYEHNEIPDYVSKITGNQYYTLRDTDETRFNWVTASGDTHQYSLDTVIDSIETARKLNSPKYILFTNNGDDIGILSIDDGFEGSWYKAELNIDNTGDFRFNQDITKYWHKVKVDRKGRVVAAKNTEEDLGIANDENFGVIKTGYNNITNNRYIPVNVEQTIGSENYGKAYIDAKDIKNNLNLETIASNIIDIHRYKELPTPSLEYKDKLFQYLGETTNLYHHGYFYKCIPTEYTMTTYSQSFYDPNNFGDPLTKILQLLLKYNMNSAYSLLIQPTKESYEIAKELEDEKISSLLFNIFYNDTLLPCSPCNNNRLSEETGIACVDWSDDIELLCLKIQFSNIENSNFEWVLWNVQPCLGGSGNGEVYDAGDDIKIIDNIISTKYIPNVDSDTHSVNVGAFLSTKYPQAIDFINAGLTIGQVLDMILFDTNNYITVTFQDHNGNIFETIKAIENSTLIQFPSNADIPGYTLMGWEDKDGNEVSYGYLLGSKNVVVYAVYEINTYILTYVGNAPSGCSVNGLTETTIREYNEEYSHPSDPTLTIPEDYTGGEFLGWYTASSGGTKIESTDLVTRAIKLYAHWSTVVAPVEYAYYGTLPLGEEVINTPADLVTEETLALLTQEPIPSNTIDRSIRTVTDTDSIIVVLPANSGKTAVTVQLGQEMPFKGALEQYTDNGTEITINEKQYKVWSMLVAATDVLFTIRIK